MAAPPTVAPPSASGPRSADSSRGLRARAERLLADNPSFPLLVVATAVFIWFAADEGGFEGTTFLPGAIVVLALLAAGLVALPAPRPRRILVIAGGLLAGYTLWCYLSITWAEQQDLAWSGANRTLLYLLVFALFALWPLRGAPAAFLAGLFGLGVAGVGLIELLRVDQASQSIQFFYESRLGEPSGYVNANVALWTSALLPCVILGSRREVPALLRGALLGSAVLLAGLTILGQSRGSVLVLPLMVVLMVVLVPARGRTLVAMGAVALAVAPIWGPLNDVYEGIEPHAPPGAVYTDALRALLMAAALLAIATVAVAMVDRRTAVSPRVANRVSGGMAIAFAAACLCGLVGYAVVKESPVTAVADKWDEFKEGGKTPSFEGSRLSLSVTTYRYDYWRVGWQQFRRNPIKGVGVDNFQRDYLRDGRSKQTPTYPHSTEIRPLSQTGIIGGLLFFGAVGAALGAALPAVRRAGLAGAAGGCGLVVFAYFALHGSIDWLWEFPALGAPAFGLLAIAGVTAVDRGGAPGRQYLRGRMAALTGGILTLVLLVTLVMPWLAERDLRSARKIAATDPSAALERLDRSSDLNPLSPVADQTAGVIELRRERLDAAAARFRKALERDPGDPFSALELGAIASVNGQRRRALRLIERAHATAPRDGPTNSALRAVRAGRRVDPERLNELIRKDISVRIGAE